MTPPGKRPTQLTHLPRIKLSQDKTKQHKFQYIVSYYVIYGVFNFGKISSK